MGLLQKIYDTIKRIRTPRWLKVILGEMQELVIAILLRVGKQYLESIKEKIIEVNGMHISNEEKFNKVFDYCREELNLSEMRESALDYIIQFLVTKLKGQKII